MNVYGELKRAQLDLGSADLTPAATGLIYFNTSSLFPKYYNGASWKTFVDTDSTQALTNKDYDGGTASNTSRITLPKAATSTLTALTRKQATIVYDTTTNSAFIDDGSNLKAIGTGAGEINLITNTSDAGNWAASGAGITVTTSSTSTDLPLAGISSSAIKITPVSSTDYVRYRFTMSEALKNKKLKLEWHQRPLSGYVSGDLKVEVYKNSASNYGGSYTEFSLSTDSSGTSSIPNTSGKFTTYFDADDADYYEIRIVRTAGTTALNIANVICGPGIQPQGAIVGQEESYTPTGTWIANSTYTGRKWRVGNRLHSWVKIALSGAPTSATLDINLPSGLTIDTSAVLAGGDLQSILGVGTAVDSGTETYQIIAKYLTTTSLRIGLQDISTSVLSFGPSLDQATPVTWGNNDYIILNYSVPIAEWSGSGTLNLAQNDIEYASNSGTWDADDTSSFAYGPNGNAFGGALTTSRSKRVQFVSPILVSDKLELEVSEDRVKWYPISQGSLNGNPVIPSMSSSATLGTSSGAWVTTNGLSDSRQATVTFARYQQLANDDTPANNWESSNAYWRVKKISGGSAVGFGIVSESAAGLVPSTNVNLDNASATRLGLKTYYHGTTYNGGNAPTVSGTSVTIDRGAFRPRQDQAGNWFVSGELSLTYSPSSASDTVTIAGITTISTNQPISVSAGSSNATKGYFNSSAGTLQWATISGVANLIFIRFDVQCASKPTWAY